MQKISQLWQRVPIKWITALIVLFLAPFVPPKAFRLIRDKGHTWVGILFYLSSAFITIFMLYIHTDPDFALTQTLLWTKLFHPLQHFTLSIIKADFEITALSWYHYILLFLTDVIIITMLISVFSIAARAMLEIEISARKLCTAIFLVHGVISLLVLPLFLNAGMSRFLEEWAALILVLIWLMFIVYITIALVIIGKLSTLKSLGLLALVILFFPIWLVGVIINVIPFLSPNAKHPNWARLASGIIIQPRATFKIIEEQNPLGKALVIYLFIAMAVFALGRVSFLTAKDDPDIIFFLWPLLFHKIHLLFSFFAVNFNFDLAKIKSAVDGFGWYVYPYLVVAVVAGYAVFTFAVHLTIQRVTNVIGRFQALLCSFLYINIAATFYLSLYPLSLLLLTKFARNGSPPDAAVVFYFMSCVLMFIWSAVLHILTIRHVYRLSGGRPLGAWSASVVMFVPVTVVTLLMEAAREATQPFRVKELIRQFQQMRQKVLDEIKEKNMTAAGAKMTELLDIYCDDSALAHRARGQVELNGLLMKFFEIAPQSALNYLIQMAKQKPEDIRVSASQILKVLLDASPEQIISSYYFLISQQCPPELLGRLRALQDSAPATELGGFLHAMLVEINENNLTAQLAQGEGLLANWRDRQHGEELYLIYRALHVLSRSATVVDLQNAEKELGTVLSLQASLLTETAQTFKLLLNISNYLVYYQRAEFENKIPYLAAPIMLLVDESRRLQKSLFPPEDKILRLLIPHLQDIILREFDGLRGRADLRFELRPQSAPFDKEVSIVLYVRNQGSAGAERLRVQLEAGKNNGFNIPGEGMADVEFLSPKREARLEFSIQPYEVARLRIPFQISYDDMEKKGRHLPFAGLIELYEPGQPAVDVARNSAFINPYITGLPIREPAMFFGREDVFSFIRSHLQGQHEKNIIVLQGQRRTGKTSILYQLERKVDEKYIPVLLDLQNFASTGVDQFMFWIARNIVKAVVRRGFAMPMPQEEQFQKDPYGYFQQDFLSQTWAIIGYHRLLLAFDEFEELAARVEKGKIDEDILPYLRSLMQHVPQLDFIFAGTYRLQQITLQHWSILFNIALYKDIGFMKPEEAAQIIREPVRGVIFYDDLAIEKITRITAGHPYFVQLLGNKLVDYYLNQKNFYLTLQDVNQVIDDVLMGGALHFDYLWKESSLIEQLLLAAMAKVISREGGAATLSDVTVLLDRFGLALERMNIVSAVKSLAARDMIVTDSDFHQFEFKIDLVRLWLERYQRFGAVAEAYREYQSKNQPLAASNIFLGVLS